MIDCVILERFVDLVVFVVCKLKNIIDKLNDIFELILYIMIVIDKISMLLEVNIMLKILIKKNKIEILISNCWFFICLVIIGIINVIGIIVNCIKESIKLLEVLDNFWFVKIFGN